MQQLKKRNTKLKDKLEYSEASSSDMDYRAKCLPVNYCISINQDGYRNMDRVSHLNDEQIENRSLENKLRPISGIRNIVKRNLTSAQLTNGYDIVKDTDIIQRISNVKTLKRLDLSYNNLSTYPRQLCDLNLLESLNLKGNNLQDNDLPLEIEKYQHLIELVLDFNSFKKIPKHLSKCKRLARLSISNNSISDLKHIEHFKRLRYLVVNSNQITQLEENIRNLDRLELLDVSHNLITSIQPNLFKQCLANLRQLDLSFCKLHAVSSEIFMLNHLEILNLSNNLLGKLPVLPLNYFRTVEIFTIDLSQNNLVRFYDYLLLLAKNIDLSSNKIKSIQSKAFERFTYEDLESKNLILINNPLSDPPADLCRYGLKIMKDYFEDVSRQIQRNKGFKIILFGEKFSGKTSLSYALEDLNSQTNLIEQFCVDDSTNSENKGQNNNIEESKLIEIHDIFLNNDPPHDLDQNLLDDSKGSFSNASTVSSMTTTVTKKVLPISNQKGIKVKKSKNDELNAFSNLNLKNNNSSSSSSTNISIPVEKSRLQMTIYDFNGSIKQYGHLVNLFLDKSALLIICIDCINYIENDMQKLKLFEESLRKLLDIIFLKMSKNNTYYILPVLTKCDKLAKYKDSNITNTITTKIENFIRNYLNDRINDIKIELKKIELQQHISASQSDRLKQLGLFYFINKIV